MSNCLGGKMNRSDREIKDQKEIEAIIQRAEVCRIGLFQVLLQIYALVLSCRSLFRHAIVLFDLIVYRQVPRLC